MIVHLLETLVLAAIGWFVLMRISTNLLGLFVRGLFVDPNINELESTGPEFIKAEVKKVRRADNWLNVVALVLIVGYLYLLFNFLNIFVMGSALMLMLGRLPDLLWEIKHGKKIDVSTMPKDLIYWLTSLLDWAALPVLGYGIYLLL